MLVLLAIAWIVGTVYATIPLFWLAIHPFTHFWKRQQRSAFRYLVPFWLVVILTALLVTYPLFPKQLYSSWIALIPAAILALGAIKTYRSISKDFRREQIIGQAELEPTRHEQKLVRTGLHGRIRHPFYLAHLLMLLAWTVGSGLAALYLMSAVAIVSGAVMISLEERELEQRFGEAYREYRKSVPALLPFTRGSR
ncbi:MAG: isoprenylcysteine carboxylmethyltransferase family protein [Acidobacteriales bacterium]|nr:isoprenylcysteine carboxylmethyltransferase family protein [Terriglobales bacterium]